MKTILVPTDFSLNAENAMHFAMVIARQKAARLILLHVYAIPPPISDISYQILFEQENALRTAALQKLKELCGQIRHMGGVEYEYVLESGPFVDTALKFCNEKKPDLVIMGTKGIDELGDRLFGTHTSQLMARVSCPVMVVPSTSKFGKPVRNIVYTTQYLETDIDNLLKLSMLAIPMNSSITILHISDELDSPEKDTSLFGEFLRKAERSLSYQKFSYELLFGDDIKKKLKDYLQKNKPDLVVMSTAQRKLLQRMFGKSLTREVMLHSGVPVIVFHHAALRQNAV